MGGWFSKWSSASAKANAKAKETSKPIPHSIIRQFEDQIYGIELSRTMPKQEIVYHPITQIGDIVVL
jgi:hypothetical protein